jgi:hypothetical protein
MSDIQRCMQQPTLQAATAAIARCLQERSVRQQGAFRWQLYNALIAAGRVDCLLAVVLQDPDVDETALTALAHRCLARGQPRHLHLFQGMIDLLCRHCCVAQIDLNTLI